MYTRGLLLNKSLNSRKVFNKVISSKTKNIRKSISRPFEFIKYPKRRNLVRKSYFYRFILRQNKSVSLRTILRRSGRPFNYQREERQFISAESRHRRNKKYTRLDSRPFKFGIIYFRRTRRNFFSAVYHVENVSFLERNTTKKTLHFKTSVGTLGFTGPKRSSNQGKELVAKVTSAFLLRNKYTSVDLVIPKQAGRWFSFLIRGFFTRSIWLRRIVVPKRRGHGFCRKRKAKRK